MKRTYAIVSWEPTPEQWAAVIEPPETCRRSLDGSLVALKWEGPLPDPFSGSTVYNHPDILAIMATPAWSEPLPEEPAP